MSRANWMKDGVRAILPKGTGGAGLAAVALLILVGSEASAQLPGWRDVERAFRPQDLTLPNPFPRPSSPPSTMYDPVSVLREYQLTIFNDTAGTITVRAIAYRDGKWSDTWDVYWNILPGERVPLRVRTGPQTCYPLLGTHFKVTAVLSNGTRKGDREKVFATAGPYESYGGYRQKLIRVGY